MGGLNSVTNKKLAYKLTTRDRLATKVTKLSLQGTCHPWVVQKVPLVQERVRSGFAQAGYGSTN